MRIMTLSKEKKWQHTVPSYSTYSASAGGISWIVLGPYTQEELSWRVKYQADDGSEAFIDVALSFSDINEAITITPVAFDSLEVGATIATISNNSSVNSDIQLAKFIKKNMYGKKIVIGMGAGSISSWMRKLPQLI